MMGYKEYMVENGSPIDLRPLVVRNVPRQEYEHVHKNAIIVCVDALIWYNGGFLLVKRENYPVKGELWPLGGRLERGVNSDEGVKRKIKQECGLDLSYLAQIGIARTFFGTDPFNHGKGSDTLNLMYVARGRGNLRLDDLHSTPTIVDLIKFKKIKGSLNPYVVDFFKLASRKLKKTSNSFRHQKQA